MTKEEAIKIIDCYDLNFYDLSGEKIPAHKLAEALDMAIEALNEKPTVIKCRIAMFPEDFKVWAERIRENNPNNNIVVIPYDAECVSGEERADECE